MLAQNHSLKRVAFWPSKDKDRCNGHDVYLWNFYWIPVEALDRCQVPYEEVPEDASTIGSDLRRVTERLVRGGSCDCDALQVMLDEANVDFIRRHMDSIVNLICASAEKAQRPVSHILVRRVLDFLISMHGVKQWMGFAGVTARAGVRGEKA